MFIHFQINIKPNKKPNNQFVAIPVSRIKVLGVFMNIVCAKVNLTSIYLYNIFIASKCLILVLRD